MKRGSPVRWGEAPGQLWGFHTGRVSPALGPSCTAGRQPRLAPPMSALAQRVRHQTDSSLLCSQQRSLHFLQQIFTFLQGNSCLRLGQPNSPSPFL